MARTDPIPAAQALCARHWGPEGGEANDFAAFARQLRTLRLSKAQLAYIRDWLPIHATGPTGERIRAIDSLLERMGG